MRILIKNCSQKIETELCMNNHWMFSLNFVLIGYQRSYLKNFFKLFFAQVTKSFESKHEMNEPWMVIYKIYIFQYGPKSIRGHRGCDCMAFTPNVVSSKPAHFEVYQIKHQVMKFVSVFFSGTPFFSTNKTDCHDITEILLKVALNTTTLTLKSIMSVTTRHWLTYHQYGKNVVNLSSNQCTF